MQRGGWPHELVRRAKCRDSDIVQHDGWTHELVRRALIAILLLWQNLRGARDPGRSRRSRNRS